MQTSLKAHVSFRTPGSGPAVLCNTIENLAIRGSYADLADQLRTLLAVDCLPKALELDGLPKALALDGLASATLLPIDALAPGTLLPKPFSIFLATRDRY